MILFFENMSKTNAKLFLEKSYSLELLFLLINNKEMSIKQTYQSLNSPKPEFNAFNAFIERLVKNNLCSKEVHKKNKSKKVIMLNKIVNEQICIILNETKNNLL